MNPEERIKQLTGKIIIVAFEENGATIAKTGKLLEVDERFLVLRTGAGNVFLIPHSALKYVKVKEGEL